MDESKTPGESSSDEEENIRLELSSSSEDELEDEEVGPKKKKVKRQVEFSSSESDEEEEKAPQNKDEDNDEEKATKEVEDKDEVEDKEPFVLDFDIMLQKKKAENRQNRIKRRQNSSKDISVINDNEDTIAALIADMRRAAEDDRQSNKRQEPATRKMAMFPTVAHNIAKVYLQETFLEADILSAITDWLAPLPLDKALPHISIRTTFLKFLRVLPITDRSRLKESGIGKAVMYLYRHPKETRANKDLAGKIISKWARPIFQLSADFGTMSREERQRRDLEMASKLTIATKKRTRSQKQQKEGGLKEGEKSAPGPGDPGWVCRARVPMVDNKEFVARPVWQSQEDLSHTPKKKISMLEKHKRKFADKRKILKAQHAVKISIEGKNMTL